MSDATEPEVSFFGASSLQCSSTEECTENEVCVKDVKKSDMGLCECTVGYKRNLAGMIFADYSKFVLLSL